MKKSFALFLVLLLGITDVAVAGEGWLTDFEEAKKVAAKKNLPILAEFAGLDWCPPCKALSKNVFQQKDFKEYAAENLVLFIADFPRPAPENPTPVQQKNNELAEKYGIQFFPTILLLNADGSVINKTGFRRGGADSYIEHIKELLK